MSAATAEPAPGTVSGPAPATAPEPVAVRVAAALGALGPGRVAVAGGELPEAVREALPTGLDVVAAGASDGPHDPDGPAPHTALLVLDGAVDGAALERRLGIACRRFPGRLLVWQRDPDGDRAPVPVERFFAFGFRRAFVALEGGRRHALHEYRLADYKQPPDWLNARFWANPERFGADPDAEARAHADAGDDGVRPDP